MDDTLAQLAAEQQRRYYGKYRGFVADNDDPRRRGRLRLRIPSVLGDAVTGWALPCLPYGGRPGQGLFLVPEIDAQVWAEFEEGLLNEPLWVGTFWQPDDDPPGADHAGEPTAHALGTAGGHLVRLRDTDGEKEILVRHSSGASVRIDDAGTVCVSDAAGGSLTLDADRGELRVEDANGNRLTLSGSGVVVEEASGGRLSLSADGAVLKADRIILDAGVVDLGGSGGQALLQQSFLSVYAGHSHAVSAAATGPPVPPPVPPPPATVRVKGT